MKYRGEISCLDQSITEGCLLFGKKNQDKTFAYLNHKLAVPRLVIRKPSIFVPLYLRDSHRNIYE